MKILTNKQYKELLLQIAPQYSAISYKEYCEQLKQELKEAKDLKSILERFTSALFTNSSIKFDGSGLSFNLPDEVLQYVDDILGGKVIKQEGTKCIVIEKDGTVKTGLTKQKADKGYSYKLVRD